MLDEARLSSTTCRLHSELRPNSLYVMVTTEDVTAEPVPLALTGLRPDSRARLRSLMRGDPIPTDIVNELASLAPRFVARELSPGRAAAPAKALAR